MSRWRLFAAVATAGLAARLVHLGFIRGHPFYSMVDHWPNSDMYQFAAWARHLAAGDWLDFETFRPWFEWQEAIAGPEVWNSWFGAHVYYQPPLYAYLVAAVLALTGSLDLFRLLQLVLGAVNCGLIALLGAGLYGGRAGLVAGVGAAVYAPFILYDAELLRGTVVAAGQLCLLLALSETHAALHPGADPGARRRRRWSLAAGAAFGVSYLADPAIVLFLPAALIWLAWAMRGRWETIALFAAGAALALAPLAARNVAVGAPLLSSTTRGPLAFVMGNAPDAIPAGAFIPESTGPILRGSGYSMSRTIAGTLALYRGDYAPLARKQWEKLRALWGAYELPDNPSFYYAARVSPAVGFGLRFLPVAALGLVGLVLTLRSASSDPRAALMPLYLLSSNALFLLAHVVSRYRQPIAIALLILGAHALVLFAGSIRSRRYGTTAGLTATLAAAVLILPWNPPPGYGYTRPGEFVIAARIFESRGEPGRAIDELDEAVRAARADPESGHTIPQIVFEKGEILSRAGRHAEAAESFRAVLKLEPRFIGAEEALARELRLGSSDVDPNGTVRPGGQAPR